jgi:glycosyltransferase involved in cell wall biosynthesis
VIAITEWRALVIDHRAMNLTLHVVTDAFPPTRAERHFHGGLAAWTCDLLDHLSQIGVEVVVYTCGLSYGIPESPEYSFEIVDVAGRRAPWESSFLHVSPTPQRVSTETQRLNFIQLRNAIRDRIQPNTVRRHAVLSNYALGAGYLATLVATDLGIPHVPAVVGTDFSRGFYNSVERHILEEVCRSASVVVCKSVEQARGLARIAGVPAIRVIPTAVDAPIRKPGPVHSDGPLKLFSDCGISFQKGSAVLIDAFLRLRAQGLSVELTLCGSISNHEQGHWEQVLSDAHRVARGTLSYLGYVDRRVIHEHLQTSHIYASCSLGEGSSEARITALCSGIPIVTTECGEFVHEVHPTSHIRVASVGDAEGFCNHLRDLCFSIRDRELEVDWDAVRRYRDSFSRQREWSAWSELLESISCASARAEAS